MSKTPGTHGEIVVAYYNFKADLRGVELRVFDDAFAYARVSASVGDALVAAKKALGAHRFLKASDASFDRWVESEQDARANAEGWS